MGRPGITMNYPKAPMRTVEAVLFLSYFSQTDSTLVLSWKVGLDASQSIPLALLGTKRK